MEQQNQPEKEVISKGSKVFIIASLLIYIAAMIFVGFFTSETINVTGLIRMSVILIASIITMIISLKKKNQKW
ncbi:MAG: hypothetical protein NTX97_04430 [Bacteroidetes bacterium]|nr:hypothetical protein [Bacteroidota bacterium]